MRLKKITAAAAGLGLALALAACGGDDGGDSPAEVADSPEFPAGTTMAKLADAGEITVGTKFDQPGFGLLNLEDVPEGFDVEVAKIIAGALGIGEDGINWREAPSAERENLIESGDVDMVVATYTMNEERAQRVTFAGPYYQAGQQLMVLSDNDTINGPEDLKDNPDMKVCSVDGSTPAENIKEYLAAPDQLVTFDVYDRCADSLSNGQVDVVTTDNVILLGFVSESDGEFKLVGEQFTEEPYGIGIEKGDVEFCEFIHETLRDNEDAYVEAWNNTAGQAEGTEEPTLPEFGTCS
ncbi:glutamate ABC transporter substrate-binding protein [Nocardioides massiliensis]|uniref:Glutamate transport system substrate-binding protein n=1 Tax=Nocardioides massiliensis TaxID=1325935 RepID=A0ABT9NQP4_9ACTN|nr:glutamate ABC transporter substrate-binding protein [Nocardioides massiliensis]MDP9822703.1 glutamate transport system substrate-binding protein [Nocardioides massiliensis]